MSTNSTEQSNERRLRENDVVQHPLACSGAYDRLIIHGASLVFVHSHDCLFICFLILGKAFLDQIWYNTRDRSSQDKYEMQIWAIISKNSSFVIDRCNHLSFSLLVSHSVFDLSHR